MPNIHHELTIGAPAEKVYNAITSQQGLSAWWTPDVVTTSEPNSIARFPFGADYYKEMKIAELKPFVQVKWICIAGDDQWIGTTISFEILSGDKKSLSASNPEVRGQLEQQSDTDQLTLLIFHQDNWKDYTPMFAECNYTWGQFLRSLKLFCEAGEGRPWPNQHAIET